MDRHHDLDVLPPPRRRPPRPSIAAADARRDGLLPMDVDGVAETFADELDLLGALQLRWHTRLAGRIERELMRPADATSSDAVVTAWRATAARAARHPRDPRPAPRRAARRRDGRARCGPSTAKEHALLAVMAGRASGAGRRRRPVGARHREPRPRGPAARCPGPRRRRRTRPPRVACSSGSGRRWPPDPPPSPARRDPPAPRVGCRALPRRWTMAHERVHERAPGGDAARRHARAARPELRRHRRAAARRRRRRRPRRGAQPALGGPGRRGARRLGRGGRRAGGAVPGRPGQHRGGAGRRAAARPRDDVPVGFREVVGPARPGRPRHAGRAGRRQRWPGCGSSPGTPAGAPSSSAARSTRAAGTSSRRQAPDVFRRRPRPSCGATCCAASPASWPGTPPGRSTPT